MLMADGLIFSQAANTVPLCALADMAHRPIKRIIAVLLLVVLVSSSQATSRVPPGTGPILITPVTNSDPAPVSAPTDTPFQIMSRRIQKLPAMTAMTMADMRRLYSDASAPHALKGSRSSAQMDRANGAVGASFSDSRLSNDYVKLGQQRVGKIIVSFAGKQYACSGSVIQRAVVLTAAHCVCQWGQGSSCFPDTTEDGRLKVSSGGVGAARRTSASPPRESVDYAACLGRVVEPSGSRFSLRSEECL